MRKTDGRWETVPPIAGLGRWKKIPTNCHCERASARVAIYYIGGLPSEALAQEGGTHENQS